MKGFTLSVPFVLAALSLAAAHETVQGGMRKSLGFGIERVPGSFKTFEAAPALLSNANADPFDVARDFMITHTGDAMARDSDYVIRQDSYTDSNTGITHVYIRQIVNGIEVADGDINLNIKNGEVLSFGDSFFKGSIDPLTAINTLETSSLSVHAQLCHALRQRQNHRQFGGIAYQGNQVVMQSSEHDGHEIDSDLLKHLDASNCAHVDTAHSFAEVDASNGAVDDPKRALLQFMIAATPKASVASDIIDKYDSYLDRMSVTMQTHLVGTHSIPSVTIDNVPDTVGPVAAKLAYVQVPSKDDANKRELQLVWKFEVEMHDNWYESAVSVSAPHTIVSVTDWTSDSPAPSALAARRNTMGRKMATYQVFPWGANDPEESDRVVTTEEAEYDSLASPAGWHAIPYKNDPGFTAATAPIDFWHNTTTTWGANVFAHEDWEGQNNWVDNFRPDAGSSLNFSYPYAPKGAATGPARLNEAKSFINNTITQLFYTSNKVHDLFYRYGFTELAGNFQQYNFGRGGRENDAVIANAQDGSGYNNANFMTPPDGQNGRCRMYLWNTANPYRDGDLEAGIVIHELAHGLSTRLTGGPANSGCLGWGEAGGMGEGWGDFLATSIRSTKTYSDYAMGAWAANRTNGIRNYPYSLNTTINPSTYKTLDSPGYWGVHAIGEVWAEILWVVQQKLIKKHGFSDTLFPPAVDAEGNVVDGDFYKPSKGGEPKVPKHGNTLSVQLVITGMKLQPCRPSFFDARDAILEADQVLTKGENFCTLWEGFSERGLGPDAKVVGSTPWGGGVRTNDYSLPSKCE